MLVGAKSPSEMQQRIAARVKAAGPGEWIRGRGWDHTKWENQKLPTREDLDGVTAGRPTIFTRVDGHISAVNTAALAAAGIDSLTPDPQGGKIDHDEQGEPTLEQKKQIESESKQRTENILRKEGSIESESSEAVGKWSPLYFTVGIFGSGSTRSLNAKLLLAKLSEASMSIAAT